jgi:hypothetical protein
MAQASIEARRILDATMFRTPTLKLLQGIAFAVALACLAPLAQAEFRQDMTLAEIETEVAAQTTAGRSAQDIAGEALGAGLEPGMVTTAMINAGIAPLVAIGAAINNGAPREAVRAGAIAAGVPIDEAIAMIERWLPGASGGTVGRSVTASSETTSGVSGLGSSGSGQIASPN